jgi:putative PIN family toxin of toxin-antitoxin system
VDTNIIVSGAISPFSVSGKIIKRGMKQEFALVTSEAINSEIMEVLYREEIFIKYRILSMRLENIREWIYEKSLLVAGLYQVQMILEDADDDKFLACALEGKSDYIVSGDSHIRSIKHYHCIQIVDACQFLDILESGKEFPYRRSGNNGRPRSIGN